jgi:hypothetical protein
MAGVCGAASKAFPHSGSPATEMSYHPRRNCWPQKATVLGRTNATSYCSHFV